MPWCETCSRYWVQSTMNADGTCPTCGRLIGPPESEVGRAPWHFKLLVLALVLYLGLRAWQGGVWLLHHL